MSGPDGELNLNPDPELSDAVRETEHEILEEAFAPAEVEGKEPAEDTGERTRDEQGRFAKTEDAPKDEKPEPETPDKQAAPEKEADRQVDEKGEDSVPRWRLREIAEERKQAQAEAQALRAELARLQVQQQQRPPQQQDQQPEPDPLIDPQGFVQRMRSEFQAELRKEALNNNLAIAHMRHGEKFEAAYSALLTEGQRGNGQLVRQLTSQGNPGEAIVLWHQQSELLRETGGDLGKFKEIMRSELRKDPEFRKAMLEDMRAEANGGSPQQHQAPRNITRLPPSLARTNGGSPNSDPIDTDDSDSSVFEFAFK